MSDEKSIIPNAAPTTDPARDAAHAAPSDFADKLMSSLAKANFELKDVKAPDTSPRPSYDRNEDPSKVPVYDPKGILPKTADITATEALKIDAKTAPKPDDYPETAKSPEAKSSWDKLKADRDEHSKKAAAYEAELLELKKQYDPQAYKSAIEEKDKLSQELRRLDVERHPQFKATYEKPINDAIAMAKRAIPEEFHSEVEKLLKQPDSADRDKAISEITDRLPLHKQTRFALAVEQASTAQEARAVALKTEAEWVNRYNAEQKETQERARIQTEAQSKALFQNVLKDKFGDNPIFNAADDTQKEAIAKRIARAESLLFGSNPPEALAEAVLNAVYAENVQPLLIQAYEEIKRLTEQQDKLTSRSMGKTGGQSSNGAPGDATDFVSRIMSKVAETEGRR